MGRLVVLGEGVGATAFLYALRQSAKLDRFSSIVQIAHPVLAPATSRRSTAIAALRGTRAGLSPLGDELVGMWEFTHSLFSRVRWAGLTEVTMESWVYSDKSERRYGHLPHSSTPRFPARLPPRFVSLGPAWIIDPATLLAAVPAPRLERREAMVTSLTKEGDVWQLGLLGGERMKADVVVLASGVWLPWMEEWLEGSPLKGMKSVQGSYFQWENVDYGAASFVLTVEGVVCSYQAPLGRLLLGSSSLSGEGSWIPAQKELESLRRDFLARVDLELPAGGEIITALRSQTKARRPWAGELQKDLYALGGLYKTGWVSAWPLGEKLVAALE